MIVADSTIAEEEVALFGVDAAIEIGVLVGVVDEDAEGEVSVSASLETKLIVPMGVEETGI